MADLQPKASANVPHKPERGVGIAAIEERSIKLREDAHSESRRQLGTQKLTNI